MNKTIKIMALSILGISILTTSSFANPNKGKKIYMKKMYKKCGITGSKFAEKHTQEEWEELKRKKKFEKEIQKICPGVKLKKRYLKHIYDFSYKYASDSGYIPSC